MTIFFALLTYLVRHLSNLSEHTERTVRSEVKGIAVGLHLPIVRVGSLYAEDRLHISCSRGTIGARHHEDPRPWLDTHPRSQSPTRERNRIGRIGVGSDGLIDQIQGIAIFLLFVPIPCDIDDAESPEDRVISQQLAQRLSRFDSRQDPEGMAEDITKMIVGEGIERVLIITAEEI